MDSSDRIHHRVRNAAALQVKLVLCSMVGVHIEKNTFFLADLKEEYFPGMLTR